MAGKTMKRVGTKLEVFHGSAHHTRSGLQKKDFMKNKHGRVVSRKKHAAGKRAIKHLFSMGYKPTKGRFVAMSKKMVRKGKRSTRKMKGGNFMFEESGSSGSQ
jgi:hypothetical protein